MPNPLPYKKEYDRLTDEEKKLLEINKKSLPILLSSRLHQ
jgi:hypothetical protein